MPVLIVLIYALGNDLNEAERINALIATVDLTHTEPIVCVSSHIVVYYNLSVAVLVTAK